MDARGGGGDSPPPPPPPPFPLPYTTAEGKARRRASTISFPSPLDAPVTRITLGVAFARPPPPKPAARPRVMSIRVAGRMVMSVAATMTGTGLSEGRPAAATRRLTCVDSDSAVCTAAGIMDEANEAAF